MKEKNTIAILVFILCALALLVGCGAPAQTDTLDTESDMVPPSEPVCTEHIWSEEPVEYSPDCTNDGQIIYYCELCYESKVEYIPAKGHTYSDEWTYDSYMHYYSATCGCFNERKHSGSHVWNEPGEVTREATCAEPEIITYTCITCPATLEVKGNCLPHTYSDEWTEDGIFHYHEGICGCEGVKSTRELHEWDEGTVITPATCNENGLSSYKCLFCTATKEEVVYKTNEHSYESLVIAPTCTEMGYTLNTCSVCGDDYKNEYTQKVPHSYECTTVQPTCQANGYDLYTCTGCDDYYKKNIVDTIDHIYVSVVYEPTCSEGGHTYHRCKMCGDYYRDSYVQTLPHTYGSVTREPTCTQKGYTTYTCTECGDTYKDDYIDPIPHEYEKTSYEAPTCTSFEYTIYTCVGCGTFSSSSGEMLPHTYESTVVAPTCTQKGYDLYTCTVCGGSYKDNYTDKIPHSYVDIICTGCGINEYSIGLSYTLSEDESSYIVSGIGTCTDIALMIPNVHMGLPVYEIAPSAFENNTNIVSVLFMSGDNGQSIGSRAFAGCTNLANVTFNSVEKIGSYAFSSTAVTELDMQGIESIGLCAFERCGALTLARLGKDTYSISYGIFAYCDALETITVNSENTEYYVKDGCLIDNGVKMIIAITNSFVIPTDDSVLRIGSYAFSGQKEITSITIPENITFIGAYAFHECENLTSLTFALTDTWYRTKEIYEAFEKTGGTSFPDGTGKWNAQFLSLYEYNYYWYRK